MKAESLVSNINIEPENSGSRGIPFYVQFTNLQVFDISALKSYTSHLPPNQPQQTSTDS